MPTKLSTTIKQITTAVPNPVNSALINDFYQYMKANEASERHQNNNLKAIIALAKFIGPDITFYGVNRREDIIAFLNTKMKNQEQDPDKKWITTWNHYLVHIKHFFRWLYNYKRFEKTGIGEISDDKPLLPSDWQTPEFIKIKKKNTKRLSPYLETELWERDELLSIIKYEPYKRNKAALALLWDLDARPHEVTLLKIKHIRLRERYGEGEIPHEAKTGTGPVLLTCSFPYVRDWLNEHPFRNESNARLICNLLTGRPIAADALWTVMKQLRYRIMRLIESGSIADNEEKERLEYLLKTKKWNPYCIRHSAITSDSDFLPEYALKKKVRWSINSMQGSRYIKKRMGNDLKNQILVHNGIITEEAAVMQRKPSVLNCPRCILVNAIDNKYCSKCSYPLIPSAFEEIKAEENMKINAIQEKHQKDMRSMREEMNLQFSHIISMIQQNPQLAYVKPEALSGKTIEK
jgi:integrase/recombinase XerD